MGGERASTTRQREAGRICCNCKAPLPPPHRPGEQPCARCGAHHRVYVAFCRVPGNREEGAADSWRCQFTEAVSRRPLAVFNFTDADKIVEMIRRGNGLRDLASRQAVENGILLGQGGTFLDLTAAQYAKLG